MVTAGVSSVSGRPMTSRTRDDSKAEGRAGTHRQVARLGAVELIVVLLAGIVVVLACIRARQRLLVRVLVVIVVVVVGCVGRVGVVPLQQRGRSIRVSLGRRPTKRQGEASGRT